MKRSVWLGFLCVSMGVSVSYADAIGTLPNGATLSFNRLFLHENNSADLVQPVQIPNSLWLYFNMAHCVCSQAVKSGSTVNADFHEATYSEELVSTSAGSPQLTQPVNFWVGNGCDQLLTRDMTCHQVQPIGSGSIGSFSQIVTTTGVRPELYVFDLMEPVIPQMGCGTGQVLSATEYAVIDTDANGMDDYFLPISIDTDTLAPPLPAVFHAEGAESAVQLSWSAPVGNVADIAYYQALCATSLGDSAFPTNNPFKPKYQTGFTLCGLPGATISFCNAFADGTATTCNTSTTTTVDAGVAIAPADAAIDAPPDADIPEDAATGGDDGGSLETPMGISQLDPSFLCGEIDDATATSMRIDNLKNGVQYNIALLAIDKYGNAAGAHFTTLVTPQPVTDFWEDLHDRGSKVEGGFCLLAETYGDDNPLTNALRRFRDDTLGDTAYGRWLTDVYYATLGKLGAVVHGHWTLRIVSGVLLLPLVAFALLWHALSLPGLIALGLAIAFARRRRRRILTRAAALASLACIALAPGRAHAQAPYWETSPAEADETPASALAAPSVKWHVGIGIGPFIPQIDGQLGVTPGPYEAMFGSSSAWMPMLSVDRVLWSGYGQLLVGIEGGFMSRTAHAWAICADPNDVACSPTNPKRMRSAGDTNSFRMIPTAVTATYKLTTLDDDYGIPIVPYAKVGIDYYVWWVSGPGGGFAKVGDNTAAGASLGVQGSIGLAVRAERIDAAAARSMRDGGIQHAGFFGEFQAAWVNGFGQDTKLSVGDSTWFAGIDFEF